jgi:hypothetical protein
MKVKTEGQEDEVKYEKGRREGKGEEKEKHGKSSKIDRGKMKENRTKKKRK